MHFKDDFLVSSVLIVDAQLLPDDDLLRELDCAVSIAILLSGECLLNDSIEEVDENLEVLRQVKLIQMIADDPSVLELIVVKRVASEQRLLEQVIHWARRIPHRRICTILECRIILPRVIGLSLRQLDDREVSHVVEHFTNVKPLHVDVIECQCLQISTVDFINGEHFAEEILQARQHINVHCSELGQVLRRAISKFVKALAALVESGRNKLRNCLRDVVDNHIRVAVINGRPLTIEPKF